MAAGKIFEVAFGINAKMQGGFSSTMARSAQIMQQLGEKTRLINGEQRQLDQAWAQSQAQVNAYAAKLQQLRQRLDQGKISENQYQESVTRISQQMKTAGMSAEEYRGHVQRLNAEMERAKAAQAAMGRIRGGFSASPITNMGNAISSTTGKISGMVGKLNNLVTLAATGFGLSALVSSSVDAGESVYQLSTKLHMSAAEATKLSRILSMTGGDVDSAAKAIGRLDRTAIADGKAGDQMRETLAGWGVVLTDNEGKLLPINEQLKNLSAGYKVAAAEGMEQEFVLATLGTKGMELTKTLQNYDEAAEQASKIKGIGLDVNQMHQLHLNMMQMKMQAGQLSLAFASAFAPLVQEVMPMILPALQEMAVFIAKNKEQIAMFVVEGVKIMLVYKSVKALHGAMNAAANMYDIYKAGKAVLLALVESTKAAAVAQWIFNAAMSANPVGLVIIAIAALVGIIYVLYQNFEKVQAFMSKVWESPIAAVLAFTNPIFMLMYLGAGIIANWETVKAWFTTLWENPSLALSQFVGFIGGKLSMAWGIISGAAARIGAAISSALSAAWAAIVSGAQSFLAFLASIPGRIIFGIGFIAGVLYMLPGYCITAGAAFVAAAEAWLSNAYTSTVTWLSNMVTSAATFLYNLPEECMAAGTAFVAAAEAWLSEAYTSTVSWLSNTVSSAAAFLYNLPEECAAAGAAFVAAAEAWASDAYNSIMNWIKQIPGAISSALSGAWDSIKAQFSGGFSVGVHAASNANGGIYQKGAFLTTFAEESAEAAIPLDGSARAIGLWEKAGQMLGITNKKEGSLTTTTETAATAAGAPPINIVQNFYGKVDAEEVKGAAAAGVEEGQKSFAENMREYTAAKERVSFA